MTNKYRGEVETLTLISSSNGEFQYSYEGSTITERIDSFWVNRQGLSQGVSNDFLFSSHLKDEYSFTTTYTLSNGNILELEFYIDSVNSAGQTQITYFHNKATAEGYVEQFAWHDSVGDLRFGVNYLDVFNWIDYNKDYLAYSKNNHVYTMNGNPWQIAGDNPCEFKKSITSLSSIIDIKVKEIKIIPNPSSKIIQLNLKEPISYKIINPFGQLVLQRLTKENIVIITLQAGQYYLEIYDGQTTGRGKLIKE